MTTTSNGARTTRAPWFVYARKSRIGVGAHITKENQWEACADYVQSVAGPDAPIVKFFDNASGYDETAYRPNGKTCWPGSAGVRRLAWLAGT